MKTLDPARVALSGTTLIEASAGTGKTYTITTLVLRLVVEAGLAIDKILVVTYTRAATSELRDRLRARLRVALSAAQGAPVKDDFVTALVAERRARGELGALIAVLERALHDLDQAPVLTIHGFCQRALTDHAFESGSARDVALTAHDRPLLDEIADDYYVRELCAASEEQISALDGNELGHLRSLAQRAAQELVLLPEEVPLATFERAAWDAAYERCRQLWQRDRETIVKLATLKAKSQARHMPQWEQKLTRVFEHAEPGELVRDVEAPLRWFSTSGHQAKGSSGGERALHPFFDEADALRSEEARYVTAAEATRLSFRRRFLRYASEELRERTRRAGVRTFDALLRDLASALDAPRGPELLRALREDYRAALVDEFQDTDPVQYRVFSRIFHGALPLFLIGDPKQAIYGFRGADVFAYMEARRHAGEQTYTLDVNRRSDAQLVAALNRLYGRVAQPFAIPGIDYVQVSTPRDAAGRFRARDGGAPLEVLVVPPERSADTLRKTIAELVASEIVALLTSKSERLDEHGGSAMPFRPLRPSDIAVLCRSNREARGVQDALRERRVPNVFQGDESVLEGEDAVEIERLLRALAHPGDARALRSFLSSIYGGLDAQAMAELEQDDRAWDEHRARFTHLAEVWLEHGFMQALRGLIVAYDVERTLLARPDGTRRLTNLWHLGELLSAAALGERLGPLGLLRWLLVVRSDDVARAELVGDAEELRLESNADAVRLTTVHKSKGLEYPVVFVPFAWDARHVRGDEATFVRFHDERGVLSLDLGSERQKENKERAEREGLAEALRLLYVGLTRGKHRVVVTLPAHKGLEKSALGYTLLGGSAAGGVPDEVLPDAEALATRIRGHVDPELTRVRVAIAPGTAHLPTRAGELALSVRNVRRVLDDEHRTSSFSALTSRARGEHEGRGLDHDAVDGPAEESRASTLVLDPFPRGAGPGQLVHEVLELADFAAGREALATVVDDVLRGRGFAPELAPMLTEGLSRVLATPLAEGLCLADLPRAKRLDELEFLLPVTGQLTPRKLEQTLRAHGAPTADPGYAARLKGLTFDALRGYLRGFVDLVFEHGGRFYVVDYKSNHLGGRAEDYVGARLNEAMAEHHYHLQYHLYVLALHRYLRQRLAHYDYETHMGGVYYLFLRGMDPAHAPGHGVFFERPTAALVAALDALFGGAP